MRVLIGCEKSGALRRAFRALGHDAWSCDLEAADDGSQWHLQGDVFEHLKAQEWELLIAHPPCTYLTCSAEWAYKDGPYHMNCKPGTLLGAERRAARAQAVQFFLDLSNAPGLPLRVCLENPIGVIRRHYLPPSQIVQPYQFGDDASKATCLWLQELPPLVIDPAKRVPGRIVGTDKKGRPIERWANQTDSGQNRLSPSAERAHLRAVTYPGIAEAMAQQWGGDAFG